MTKSETIRKRNIELNQRVEELEQQIADMYDEDKARVELAETLIAQLHETKDEYERVLEILESQKIEYDKLIAETKELKTQMKKDMWQMVRYLLFNKIKKIFQRKHRDI